jgi:hypothetical protein
MSGTPKYTQAQLKAQRRRELEEARRRQQAEERRRREEAARRECERRLAALRGDLQAHLGRLASELSAAAAAMYDADHGQLHTALSEMERVVRSASSERDLGAQSLALDGVRQAMATAVSRKRRDDEERQRREERLRLQFELDEIGRQVQALGEADSRKFDAAGSDRLESATRRGAQSLQAHDPAAAAAVREAWNLLEAHRRDVLAARERWTRAKAAAEEALGRMDALVAGLHADPVVARWRSDAVSVLEGEVATLRVALASEAFDRVAGDEARVEAREQAIVAEAGAAQLQADTRDAIAASMAGALGDLGYIVSAPALEQEADPGSAVIFQARSAAGQAIGVSVPVEGDVWYEVAGFPMEARGRVDGRGTAAACDLAEAVLEDLHVLLRDRYGVATDGVNWEGKDPDRMLRRANQLPQSSGEVRRGAR